MLNTLVGLATNVMYAVKTAKADAKENSEFYDSLAIKYSQLKLTVTGIRVLPRTRIFFDQPYTRLHRSKKLPVVIFSKQSQIRCT